VLSFLIETGPRDTYKVWLHSLQLASCSHLCREAQLEQLARSRADAVQSAVLDNSQVEPERVFLSERESGKMAVLSTSCMELRLEW